ncbi:FHA domain-containing protein [Vulcanisaeta sp. JCM 16159]|uniref:FHA domain-containing protein n=1 Tax=Vulcanisaeta sp. JCM 16159 TaxID=1295371 RepID=UPI000AB50D61|nr:FHA domain-containing protein [Vulcanisaeta sp. JCM 16159]
MTNHGIKTLKASLIIVFIITTLILPSILMSQVPQTFVDVGCGPIVIYPSDSSGNPQSVFNVGESLYVTLRLQSQSASNCNVNIVVTGRTPSGATETLYSGSLSLVDYQNSYLPLINPISSSTPTGTWTIVVTVSNPNTGQTQSASFEVDIGVSPTPTPAPTPSSSMSPLFIAIIVAVVIIIAAIGAVMYLRRPSTQRQAAPAQPPPQITAPPPSPRPSVTGPTIVSERREATKVGVVLYRLRLPNGVEVPVTEAVRVFGRETFERYGVPPDVLQMISREERGGHFRIFLRGNKWYVEDLNSTNGTLLNGKEIKGKGPQELKNGDTISPAGVLDIKFIAEESTQVYTGGG